jgi:hypothetical protein
MYHLHQPVPQGGDRPGKLASAVSLQLGEPGREVVDGPQT